MPDFNTDSLIDSFGRRVTYLRVSLTDRCNYRCLYCMPPEGADVMPHEQILTDDAIVQFVRVAASLGVERIRLTGGEPLLRKGLVELVARLAKIPGVKDLGLTTNGSHLTALAQPLREAGLTRINVSLDSLEAEAFEAITGGGRLSSVMAGIDAAMDAGLPLKINVVVLRGMNEGELLDFARLALRRGVQVRFIEFMPLDADSQWQRAKVLFAHEFIARLEAEFGALRAIDSPGVSGGHVGGHSMSLSPQAACLHSVVHSAVSALFEPLSHDSTPCWTTLVYCCCQSTALPASLSMTQVWLLPTETLSGF